MTSPLFNSYFFKKYKRIEASKCKPKKVWSKWNKCIGCFVSEGGRHKNTFKIMLNFPHFFHVLQVNAMNALLCLFWHSHSVLSGSWMVTYHHYDCYTFAACKHISRLKCKTCVFFISLCYCIMYTYYYTIRVLCTWNIHFYLLYPFICERMEHKILSCDTVEFIVWNILRVYALAYTNFPTNFETKRPEPRTHFVEKFRRFIPIQWHFYWLLKRIEQSDRIVKKRNVFYYCFFFFEYSYKK